MLMSMRDYKKAAGSHKLGTPVKLEIEPRSPLERFLIGIFIGLPAGCIGIACGAFGYEILFYDKSYWGLLVFVIGLVLIFISWQILAGKTKGYTKELVDPQKEREDPTKEQEGPDPYNYMIGFDNDD